MAITKTSTKKTERQLLDIVNSDGVVFEKVPFRKNTYLIEFKTINTTSLEQDEAIKELIKEYGYIIEIVIEFKN